MTHLQQSSIAVNVSSNSNAEFEGFEYQGAFIISETDKKEYRHVILDNGLRLLLIHEPEGLAKVAGSLSSAASSSRTRTVSNSSSQQRRNRGGGGRRAGGYSANASESEDDPDYSSSSDDYDDTEESETDESGSDERGARAAPASARRSACAVCVNSGSADEGADALPGLAHWLEHMLFMGSAKYPKENDFDAFVAERGGGTNAWTDMEQTLFYFDCRTESFIECLDRFANFFVEPLLDADCLEREVQAVHSEFEHACTSLQSQLEYFMGCIASPGHPLAGFKWGNRKSLWEGPKAAGLDVRARLQEFRQAHYRAGNMTAALQSRLGLDEMEAAAKAAFAGLTAGSRVFPSPISPTSQPPFGEAFRSRVYCLLPVKQVDRLRISWCCPPIRGRHLDQPHRILGFCLAHEGTGSLADCLRREGLVVELEAGVHSSAGMSDNSWASMMELTVKLTPKGLLDWRRVVRIVYTYVGMLGRNLEDLRRIFEEIRGVDRAAWRFAEEVEPTDSVESLSVNMHRLPQELWLLGDQTVPHKFNLEGLRSYWETLRPENACILLASRTFEGACDRVTEWFEMRYSQLAPDHPSISDWQNCLDNPDTTMLSELQLHLPTANPFIAAKFDVSTPEAAYTELGLDHVPQYPVRIFLGKDASDPGDKFGELHYLKEKQFGTPRAVVRISLESPVVSESAKSVALTQLWLYLLNFQLHRDAYAANEAGLSYEIVLVEPFSILIDLEGFNDKLFVLYSTILDKWSSLGELLATKDASLKFDSAKEEVRKVLANQLLSPKRFTSNLRHFLLEENRHLLSDQLACLESICLEDVTQFHRKFLASVYVKAYVHGNCGPQEARDYFHRTLKLLPADSDVAEVKNTCAAIPSGRNGVRLLNMRSGDVNSVLFEEFQLPYPPSIRRTALADLLLHIMWEPCFDFLRTKHQLGYHVSCGTSRRHGMLSFYITVACQADNCAMDKLQTMVDKFALHFVDTLKQLTPKQFKNYVNAVIEQKMAEDSAMTDEADRNWAEIADGAFVFDRRVKEAQILGELKLDELRPFYEQPMTDIRRSFSFQVEGSKKKSSKDGGTSGFSMPLAYSTTASAKSMNRRGGSGSLYTRPVCYTNDLKLFKSGLHYHPARPVLD